MLIVLIMKLVPDSIMTRISKQLVVRLPKVWHYISSTWLVNIRYLRDITIIKVKYLKDLSGLYIFFCIFKHRRKAK